MLQTPKLKELSFLVYGLGISGKSVIKFFKKNEIKKFEIWDDNQKNLILAVVFSLIVLIGYDFFFNPKTKRVSQEQFENIEDSNQRPDQDIPSLDKKEKDIEGQKEKRIFFRSQRLEGSINLYGATFDDIFLKDYFNLSKYLN